MTTEPTTTRTLPACLMDVCEVCNWPETVGSEGLSHKGWHGHDFVPHTHSVECSARFYREFFGCDARYQTFERHWECCCVGGVHRVKASIVGRLPDIIASPGTDEAWLAMRDAMDEAKRRGVLITMNGAVLADGARGWFVQYRDAGGYKRTSDKSYDDVSELPRAVALAAWAVSMEATE